MQKNSFRNQQEVKDMTHSASAADVAEDIRNMIVDAGGGRGMGETYEQMVWRAARALGMRFARAWSVFLPQGEAARPPTST